MASGIPVVCRKTKNRGARTGDPRTAVLHRGRALDVRYGFLLLAVVAGFGGVRGVVVDQGGFVERGLATEDLVCPFPVELLGPRSDQDGRDGVAREVGQRAGL